MDNKRKVSVIIPSYKRSEMLPRAIDSVLTQTYQNIEVIVVDDNNPGTEWREKTKDRMFQYKSDPRVIYVMHEKNMNGSVARNTGIKRATGDIIAFLDDDDFFYPTKIEKQVKALLEKPEFHANYCGWKRAGKTVIPEDEGDLSYNLLSGDHIIYTNAIIMWRKDAMACGGWDETFKRHQEAAFLLRYFKTGEKISCLPEILLEFDISDRGNATSDPKINEKQVKQLLDSFTLEISKFDKKRVKTIFIHRYRGIFLGYVKAKSFFGALTFFFKNCLKFPFAFIGDVVSYTVKKVESR